MQLEKKTSQARKLLTKLGNVLSSLLEMRLEKFI